MEGRRKKEDVRKKDARILDAHILLRISRWPKRCLEVPFKNAVEKILNSDGLPEITSRGTFKEHGDTGLEKL